MAFIVYDESGNPWSLTINPTDGSIVTTQVATTPPSPGVNPNCTLTLQSVVNWARTQAKMVPIVGVGGFSNEPALSICNNVLQEILSPPYNWKWNRVEAQPFVTVAWQQDYTAFPQDANQIGWLESAVAEYYDATNPPVHPDRFPLTVVNDLSITSDYGDPAKLAVLYDSNFAKKYRIWPLPTSAVWKIYPIYQVQVPVKSALTDLWNPVPDYLGYVIRQGFLAMALRHANDPRADAEYAKFQALMLKALGKADAEMRDDGFYPMRPLLIG